MTRILLFVILILAIPSMGRAQIEGLWHVKSVLVDGRDLTPVAKWFSFDGSSNMASGNGWVQNYAGTYHYDVVNKWLQATDRFGRPDEMGPFATTLSDLEMRLTRTEEGSRVVITLIRAIEKPMAPWDLLEGLWLAKFPDILNTGEPTFYFFRWDRRFVALNKDNQRFTGYWHIESHSPLLTLIDEKNDRKSSWTLSMEGTEMLWTNDETKSKIVFYRTFEFPDY